MRLNSYCYYYHHYHYDYHYRWGAEGAGDIPEKRVWVNRRSAGARAIQVDPGTACCQPSSRMSRFLLLHFETWSLHCLLNAADLSFLGSILVLHAEVLGLGLTLSFCQCSSVPCVPWHTCPIPETEQKSIYCSGQTNTDCKSRCSDIPVALCCCFLACISKLPHVLPCGSSIKASLHMPRLWSLFNSGTEHLMSLLTSTESSPGCLVNTGFYDDAWRLLSLFLSFGLWFKDCAHLPADPEGSRQSAAYSSKARASLIVTNPCHFSCLYVRTGSRLYMCACRSKRQQTTWSASKQSWSSRTSPWQGT